MVMLRIMNQISFHERFATRSQRLFCCGASSYSTPLFYYSNTLYHIMYLLPAVVGLLALDIASALELPAIFRSRKRQSVDDITVKLPSEAADAFKTFFSDKTTFSTCPQSMGGPPPESTDTKPTKRQDVGGAKIACYYGIGKVATSLVTDGHALSSLYKASKQILINHEEPPTYQDPKVQEAFAAHLLAGAKMLEQNYPGIDSGVSNKIFGAIFLASRATIVAKATYYGYYGVCGST